MSGRNPMRWDCKEHGCFNWKKRPKIEEFADCLPGNIKFGDIDGIVDINGRALAIEWKGDTVSEIPTGQRIMYERLSREGILTVLMLVGDARTMVVLRRALARRGKITTWQPCTLEDAKEYIKRWAEWAGKQRLATVNESPPNLVLVGAA